MVRNHWTKIRRCKPAAAAAMAAAPSAPAQSEPLQQSPSLDRTPLHMSSVILTATIERVCLTAHEQSRHATVHETDSIPRRMTQEQIRYLELSFGLLVDVSIWTLDK